MKEGKNIEKYPFIIKIVQIFDTIIFGIMYAVAALIIYSAIFLSLVFVKIACIFGLLCSPAADSNRRKPE
jgi:NADH:ubiquinone oxidoreductase subunit 6 (subunit J)